jgi:hypothetical protein
MKVTDSGKKKRLKSDGDGGERVSISAGDDGCPARGRRSEFKIYAGKN